jgi:hypothetical protein
MRGIARRLNRDCRAVDTGWQRTFGFQGIENGAEMGGEAGVKRHVHASERRSARFSHSAAMRSSRKGLQSIEHDTMLHS